MSAASVFYTLEIMTLNFSMASEALLKRRWNGCDHSFLRLFHLIYQLQIHYFHCKGFNFNETISFFKQNKSQFITYICQISHPPKTLLKFSRSTVFTGILKAFKIGKLFKKLYLVIAKKQISL